MSWVLIVTGVGVGCALGVAGRVAALCCNCPAREAEYARWILGAMNVRPHSSKATMSSRWRAARSHRSRLYTAGVTGLQWRFLGDKASTLSSNRLDSGCA